MPHKSAFAENIILDEKDHCLTVIIDRPRRKNAITAAMWGALAEIFTQQSTRDDLRAIILKGSGADFSAGADISEFDSHRGDAQSAAHYEALNEAAFAAVRHCLIPVIAEIRGICFGGGFGLAAAAHLRIADKTARFKVPAARLGLAYPVNSVQDIVHGVGVQQARHLLLAAEELSASKALNTGFLLDVVAENELAAKAIEIADAICANAPLSVRASQFAIQNVITPSPDTLSTAIKIAEHTFDSEDYREGREAFKAKRAPHFKGR